MPELTASEVTVAGQRLAYELVGAGEPVVFVNNLALPAAEMRAFAPELNAAGYQLVLVDHLGPADVTIESAAAHLGGLLDVLDIRPWLWGYSQGAFIAQELSLLRPDRVRGAVLVATRGRVTRFFQQYVRATGEVEGSGTADRVDVVLHLLATLPPDLLCDDDMVDFAARGVERARRNLDPERHRRSVRASADYGDRLEALAGVRVPCLAVSFERDLVCPPRLGREVADAIPDCGYLELPDAGHGGITTHAADVLAAVTGFFTRTGGR